MATVWFRGATRYYQGTARPAVDRLDLEVADGEFLVLVGPSGCGKSTTLRMLAGLEGIDEGTVSIGGRDVTDLPPKDRDIAMVFQNYALYPHLTVRDNIGFHLRIQRVPKPEIGARVAEAARLLGLVPYLDRRPAQLSGGQRQRVAMGRAIVRRPKVFLMDEPLSNLDAKLRVQTRTQIASLQRELAVTTVYVTHDQVEAMTMGDRVAVLDGGVLQQCDSPAGLYTRPANVFVAGFIGSPAMNLLAATVRGGAARGGRADATPRRIREGTRGGTRSGTRDTVRSGEAPGLVRTGHRDATRPAAWGGVRDGAPDEASGQVAAVDDLRVRITRAQRAMLTGESVVIGVRPEAFEVVSPADGMAVTVEMVENIGSDSYLYCTAGTRPSMGVGEAAEPGEAPHPLTVRTSGMSRYARGDRIGLRPEPGATHLFDAATGERLPD